MTHYHSNQPFPGGRQIESCKSGCGLPSVSARTARAQTAGVMSDTPAPAPAAAPAAPDNTPSTPPASPEAPPATRLVVTGTKTEREIELERKLDEEATARRKAETDAAYHADEARRLKELQSQPPVPPKRVRRFMGFEQEVDE